MKKKSIYVALWLMLTAAGYAIGHTLFDPADSQAMVINGKAIDGKVVSIDLQNHASIGYVYSVGGKQYSGSGHAGADIPLDKIREGDNVRVFYDTTNPQRSILGDPKEDLLAEYTGIAYFTVVFSGVWMALLVGAYLALRPAKPLEG